MEKSKLVAYGMAIVSICSILGMFSSDDFRTQDEKRWWELRRCRFLMVGGEVSYSRKVGYLSDLSGPQGSREFFLAQYELAPAVIDNSTNYAVILGNFFTNSAMAGQLLKAGYEITYTNQYAVILFERDGRR